MAQTQELRKPVFVKVADLEKERSGYNVYVKVVSAEAKEVETRDGQKIKMVDAIVGDETARAKAFFKGANAADIETGKVIAIRNGVKKYIKNFISLELDIFGRVTPEKIQIASVGEKNISEVEHKLENKPRRNNNNRGGPRNRRGQNRDGRQQRRGDNRRADNNRPLRNDRRNDRYEDRGYNNDRRQNDRRYERDDRGDRNFDRYDRRDNDRYDDRRDYRRENRDYQRPRRGNREYDRDFDRRDNNYERAPRRYNEDRPRRDNVRYEARRNEPRDSRAPVQWTKIEEISPGDDRLNIVAKVLSEQLVNGKRQRLRCVIGDESAVVNAFLPAEPEIRVGSTVALIDCEARVIKEHIEIQISRSGHVEQGRKNISRVNESYSVSEKSWVPVE